ncbi:MAG: LytTR family DNA-binding domain-containing protein [Vicinamibacterales bacterium]|nr:LytTR family DNA-binding domain-containing protein [Vicinamibacterales bacterium]
MNARFQAVVVDDELPAREELIYLLGQVGGVELVGQASNGVEGLALIESARPHAAFLDVQMPGLNGFEVARQLLDRQVPTNIVFVTAFDQYAIDAFEVNAVDYLLKPVEQERLERSVDRLAGRVGTAGQADDRLERVVQLVVGRQQQRSQLAVKVGDHILLVHAEDLVFASMEGDTIHVVTSQLTGTSNYRTLDELQARLDPNVFWRVHRSHLVNINKIKEIVPWFSRNFVLRMTDSKGTEIPVSRTQTKRLRDYLRL